MQACFGPNMYANSRNYNYYSGYAKVSFEGFINENYFLVKNQEKNLIQNLEITHAVTKNPFTYKKDAFIGLFLKSKYDGIGNRNPINISVALDISGSMSGSRINLAKKSLKKLISIMDEKDDKMSLITFNHETQKIFGLLDKNEIEKKFLYDLDAIKAGGGTDLVGALELAMSNINNNNENLDDKKEKRIVMITDVEYDDNDNELLKLFKKCVEEKNISITIIAISSESNISLANKVSHFKGCNYFPITKTEELEDYLVKNFNYIFFPIAHETKLTIKSENATILKCIGADYEISDEYDYENKAEKSPKPSKEITFEFGSGFSSELIKIKNNENNELLYSKGGLLLLKINPDDLNKNENLNFDFNFEYISIDGKKICQNYSYIIENKKEEKEINYFKDNNIRKGISIYYFCIILNHIVETLKNGLKNEKDEIKKKKDLKLLETKQVMKEYLNNNFIIEPNNQETIDNLNNYLEMIEERYSGYKKSIYSFYNLDSAPLPY